LRICVMGAGAVGSYYGAKLQKAGNEVFYICRGEQLKALKKNGLYIKSPDGDLKLKVSAGKDPGEFAPYDLVLFTVKSRDTIEASSGLIRHAGKKTIILSLQNGLTPALMLRKFFSSRVMGGVAFIANRTEKPGVIRHYGAGSLSISELENRHTERLDAVKTLFKEAGIPCSVQEDFNVPLWKKLMWNTCFNPLSVIFEQTLGPLVTNRFAVKTGIELMNETWAVADALGIKLDREAVIKASFDLDPALHEFETSMLQDFRKGKPMETDEILGAVLKKADALKLQAPRLSCVYDILKAKEMMNTEDGK